MTARGCPLTRVDDDCRDEQQIAVGDRRVVARMKERQEALRAFQAAKQQGKTASLSATDEAGLLAFLTDRTFLTDPR